jgi:hypothetical protein
LKRLNQQDDFHPFVGWLFFDRHASIVGPLSFIFPGIFSTLPPASYKPLSIMNVFTILAMRPKTSHTNGSHPKQDFRPLQGGLIDNTIDP